MSSTSWRRLSEKPNSRVTVHVRGFHWVYENSLAAPKWLIIVLFCSPQLLVRNLILTLAPRPKLLFVLKIKRLRSWRRRLYTLKGKLRIKFWLNWLMWTPFKVIDLIYFLAWWTSNKMRSRNGKTELISWEKVRKKLLIPHAHQPSDLCWQTVKWTPPRKRSSTHQKASSSTSMPTQRRCRLSAQSNSLITPALEQCQVFMQQCESSSHCQSESHV